jgi:hypothetical protein
MISAFRFSLLLDRGDQQFQYNGKIRTQATVKLKLRTLINPILIIFFDG